MTKPHSMPQTGGFLANPDFSLTAEERCNAILQDLIADPAYSGADTPALSGVRLISADADKGTTVWELTIEPHMCNKANNLHGGAAATIMDNLTSTALFVIARPGFLDGGHVSRTITMTYLRPVPVGATVRVESEAVSGGRGMAHCRGVLRTMPDGKACVLCQHDKAVVPPRPKI